MKRSRVVMIGAGVVLVVVVAIGLSQTGGGSDTPTAPSRAEVAKLLAGSPGPLARLHAQGNRLVGTGKTGLRTQLAALKGYPVVVNKWASWCGPCRAEFPTFQRVGAEQGRRVAFLGLNSGDDAPAAKRFLGRFPLSYPSVDDHRDRAATSLDIGSGWPMTAFFDRTGKQTYIHQGPYLDQASLERDIQRYAVDPAPA